MPSGTTPTNVDPFPNPSTGPTATGEVVVSTPSPPGSSGPLVSLAYEQFARDVPFPVFLTPLPGTGLLIIASKEGRLWIHDGVDLRDEPFLDIRNRVRDNQEQGLLGVAFSPDFAESGRFFVHYTGAGGETVLAEFRAAGMMAEADTEVVVYQLDQPARNHNGGMIEFGPDGFLYMGLGDGGGSNDRFGNGQNFDTPLGALLRFDTAVPGKVTPAAGNPFPALEVWSVGLRNPWRFSIDHQSGLILIADVGQGSFEEISVARLSEPGLNYGWPITEGLHCFRPSSACEIAGLTLPVLEVARGDGGTCSITGGVVYRGSLIPELYGHYLFSDFCGGYLRSFPLEGGFDQPTDWTDQVGDAGSVTSFGVDAGGEVYVLNSAGVIWRIVAIRD